MGVLRAVVLLMVLGSLLLFAYGQGYFGRGAAGGEPERFASQIEPQKLRVVGKGGPPATTTEPERDECRAFGGLPHDQARRLIELLGARDAQLKRSERALDEPSSWWVLIPPHPNRQQAEKKAIELKKLGVQEFFVVQESGPNRYAISLGLFKNEQGAREYFETLNKMGVRSARVQARESASGKTAVEARGPAQRIAKALSALPPEFASASPLDCVSAK